MTLFMVTDLGFNLQMVALATSASFLLVLFSKVLFGWLFDLASLKGISICYVIIALSIALAFGIQGFITLMIFQLSRGFAHSGILIETPILAKHIFGPFHLGKVIGIFSAITAVGLTFGPITVAKLYQMAGNSYYPAFGVLTGIMLICAVVIHFVPPEYRLKKQRARMGLEQSAA